MLTDEERERLRIKENTYRFMLMHGDVCVMYQGECVLKAPLADLVRLSQMTDDQKWDHMLGRIP